MAGGDACGEAGVCGKDLKTINTKAIRFSCQKFSPR